MRRVTILAGMTVGWLLGTGVVDAQPGGCVALGAETQTVRLWPATPPGDDGLKLPEEGDTSGPDGRGVAGRPVIRIGNVTHPELAIYPAPADKATGAAVVVCPGGGHRILAYDLEGTEVAEWLNSRGVTALVLKYRVPAREGRPRWHAAVQDAQRALSLTRAKASDWGIKPDRIGILGFSAGGETAARAALMTERQYSPVDATDDTPWRPDFGILIYPAYLVDEPQAAPGSPADAPKPAPRLREDVPVSKDSPPMFLAHAYDDPVTPMSSVLLFAALKQAGVRSELHIYSQGGHGYGLRPTETPVTSWPRRCEEWLAKEVLRTP